MNPPPTVQRTVKPSADIAPYALVTVHAAPEAGVSDIRPLIERWTGVGDERTHSWLEFAAAHHLIGTDATPFFRPDFVYCGRHRWVAISQEAPGEMHIFAGLCVFPGEAPAHVRVVADRAATLIQILVECRLERGGHRIRVKIAGTMHMHGGASGHEYHQPRSYLPFLAEADTLKEALPLFVASYGGLFSSGPASRLPLSSYASTLVVGVLAYCFLAWMRWVAAGTQARWTSTGWPQ